MTHTTPSIVANTQILQHLYNNSDVWMAVDEYCRELEESGSEWDKIHCQKLKEYKKMATCPIFRADFDTMSNELYEFLDTHLPRILFKFISRKKSLTRTDDKLISLILENLDLPEEKRIENPLNRVGDFYAARIIITNTDIIEATNQLYLVGNLVAEFFEGNPNFELCIAKPVKDTLNFDQKKFPGIYVPLKSKLLKKYRKYFKDYVIHPKENGYQSLHITVKDKYSGFMFEIQIRTQHMHVHAELNDLANHSIFRDKQNYTLMKHGMLDEIDFNRIHINGFLSTGNSEIPYDDQMCILDSLVMLQRTKSIEH